MSKIGPYNHEGYYDPTAFLALNSVAEEQRRKQKEVRISAYTDNPYRPLVFICSPYAGDIQKNTDAARKYSKFAVDSGTIPFAPHLLFPQFLNDHDEYERELGMLMGLAILTKCAEVWVFGIQMSPGMRREVKKAKQKEIPVRYFDTECREVQV